MLRFICALVFAIFFFACSPIKNYPANKPFIFDNKVILEGNLSKDEKKRLTAELDNYWYDSIKARKATVLLFFYSLKNPPAFDTTNITRSRKLMNDYLNSQGYYYASFKDSIRIDTIKDQQRVYASMKITTGKNIRFDSIAYQLNDSVLQTLTLKELPASAVKKGLPYSKQAISQELDRLTLLYRNNGYLKLYKDDLRAEVDTIDKQLMTLSLDPFEQANAIEAAAKKRKENPTWDVLFKSKPLKDSTKFLQYKIGHIYYYPETTITDPIDSIVLRKQNGGKHFQEYTIYDQEGKFILAPLKEHTFFKKGDVYNEKAFIKTMNSLSQIGAWQNVDGRTQVRDKDTVDMHLFLVPNLKQNYSIDLEGSRNTGLGNFITGNFLGVSTNFTYRNRNVWKRAIQSATSLRAGVELTLSDTAQLLQSTQFSISHSYSFPRLILPFRIKAADKLDDARTLLSLNGAYTDRRDIFRLRSLVGSWGYEWKKGNTVWLYKPLNLELYGLERLSGLDSLLDKNPFLKYTFNNGNVVSQSFGWIKTMTGKRSLYNSHYLRFGAEESGFLTGLFPSLYNQIFRFIKGEAEYRFSHKKPKTEFAYRAFLGVGWNYSNDASTGRVMPFFKQFAAGGPNSMRAWQIRQLGLGSSRFYDSSGINFRERFGDMQLEFNLEYRYTIWNIGAFKIGGAIFSDIGNIWNIRKDSNLPDGEFALSRLGRDLAIGVGTGIRFDFSYFLIRLDAGYKLKDPARPYNGGWARLDRLSLTETRPNGVEVRNAALQLGIGLPF